MHCRVDSDQCCVQGMNSGSDRCHVVSAQSLLHGSDQARGEGMTAQSHSTAVGRNKYVHEISRVAVQPAHVEAYKKVLGDHLPRIAADPALGARLVGAWEVVVGDLETFCELSPPSRFIPLMLAPLTLSCVLTPC